MWRRFSHSVDMRDTGRTEGIQTHTVLCLAQTIMKLCLQKEEFSSGEKAFEQGVLCPPAKSLEDLMDFGPPTIISNVIRHNVAHGLASACALSFHLHVLSYAKRGIGIDFPCQALR